MHCEAVIVSCSPSISPELSPILSKICSQYNSPEIVLWLVWVFSSIIPRSNWGECQAGGHRPLQPQNCPSWGVLSELGSWQKRKRVLANSLCCTCSEPTRPTRWNNLVASELPIWRNERRWNCFEKKCRASLHLLSPANSCSKSRTSLGDNLACPLNLS